MIENECQYLITYREARRFRQAIARVCRQLEQETHVVLSDLLRISLEALESQYADLQAELFLYQQEHDKGRRGEWLPTWSGRRFWLLDPRPQDIVIEDIAQGLSRTSRYYGATRGDVGYTVAQHSVLASHLGAPEHRLALLLHDASEAYVGDVISPLKKLLGQTYRDIEDRIMVAVASRFNFSWGADEVQQAVQLADEVLLATEVRDLLPLQFVTQDVEEPPLPFTIEPWSQERAKEEFLCRFWDLTR